MATAQENEITKLNHLHQQGALTDEEFEAQKQAVMAAPQRRSIGDNAGMRALLPVGRSPLAIAAGYVGLASFVVWPAALVAIVLGILAIRDIKRNEGKHGMGRAIFALIAGGIVIVGFLVLMISAALG
jgi:hypothetical protein